MSNINERVTYKLSNFREFFPEIPDEEMIDWIAQQTVENRQIVQENAEEWGFDPDFIAKQGPIVVGPFFSPGPIPTEFGGDPLQYATAMDVGLNIGQALIGEGLPVKQAALVTLDLNAMPNKGKELIDVILTPSDRVGKNDRQKLADPRYEQPYCQVKTNPDIIGSALWNVWRSRTSWGKRMGLSKSQTEEIFSVLASDVPNIEGEISYTQFMGIWNNAIQMQTMGYTIPIIPVDTTIYEPFLRYGILDFEQFAGALSQAGLFNQGPQKRFKVADPAFTRLRSVRYDPEDKCLQMADEYDDRFTFQEMCYRFPRITVAKALSYVLCFGQIVPVVYGCDNRGEQDEIYEPYAQAKSQVENLGLSPILYRVQPRTSYDLNKQGTILDYYKALLFPSWI